MLKLSKYIKKLIRVWKFRRTPLNNRRPQLRPFDVFLKAEGTTHEEAPEIIKVARKLNQLRGHNFR